MFHLQQRENVSEIHGKDYDMYSEAQTSDGLQNYLILNFKII